MSKLMGKEINAILGAQTILIWTYELLLQFQSYLFEILPVFCQGLKMCIWFGCNLQIIFVIVLQFELRSFCVSMHKGR